MTTHQYTQETNEERLIKDVVVLAGRILLESGAEGSRVEDTMTRIANNLGYSESQSFVTNTMINFMLHNDTNPRIFRINKRETNLLRISRTNSVSRDLANGEITLKEAYDKLDRILNSRSLQHDLVSKFFAAAIISISFLYLQEGHLIDIFTTLIAGAVGYIVVELLSRKLQAGFIPEFIGSLIIGLIAILGHSLFPDGSLSAIIIASVMPIVPGMLITNAVQDLFAGHMLMFTTKSLEALVTSFGIGAGVGTVLLIV